MTLFLFPHAAKTEGAALTGRPPAARLASRAHWPTSCRVPCSPHATAARAPLAYKYCSQHKQQGGVFFEGTRERAGKLKEGESFFEQKRGERERSKGRKGPSNAETTGGVFWRGRRRSSVVNGRRENKGEQLQQHHHPHQRCQRPHHLLHPSSSSSTRRRAAATTTPGAAPTLPTPSSSPPSQQQQQYQEEEQLQ